MSMCRISSGFVFTMGRFFRRFYSDDEPAAAQVLSGKSVLSVSYHARAMHNMVAFLPKSCARRLALLVWISLLIGLAPLKVLCASSGVLLCFLWSTPRAVQGPVELNTMTFIST